MHQPTLPGCVVLGRLGQGSSGTVWLAERERDGLRVAVKVLSGNGTGARAQAIRELTVLSRTVGEHVVRLHEAVPLADGGLALVLDLADGGSLAGVVAGRGHLSPGETVTVLTPLAGALADLHEAGVVHADVSPGNVLFTKEGKPMLADLGVSRLVGEVDGEVHGTTGFVAPEVVDGDTPTPAADVHALGALGWLALTGTVPPPPAVRPPLATVVPQAPPALVGAVERALAPEPQDRPGARELALAVFDAAPGEPVRLGEGSDPAQELTHRLRAQAARPATPTRASRRTRPRRRVALVALCSVAGLALATPGAVASWRLGRSIATPAPAPAPQAAPSPGPVLRRGSRGPDLRALGPHIGARSAAESAPRALLQDLADLRARAWVEHDRLLLMAVDAPQSPALQTDLTQLAQLEAQGAGYEGLRFTVREASGSRHGDTATVRARVDTADYTVVGADGAQRTQAGRTGRALTFRLTWTSLGWRITSYA